jgi:hypothetical protein
MADPVTPSDIAILLQRELTESEEAAVALYIELAEGEIEDYLGRPIRPTEFVEEGYVPNVQGVIYLRNTPVISVQAIDINGEEFATNALTVTTYGLLNAWGLSWPSTGYSINGDVVDPDMYYGGTFTISYTAGLDYPKGIRSLIIGGVYAKILGDISKNARATMGNTGIKTIQAEDFLITYEHSGSMSGTSGLTFFPSQADFVSISRYRKPGII